MFPSRPVTDEHSGKGERGMVREVERRRRKRGTGSKNYMKMGIEEEKKDVIS